MVIDPAKRYTATMVTSKGTMVIALDPLAAPRTVNNFVFLARYHYFDGIVFHRIIPGFVLQGGDPRAPAGRSRLQVRRRAAQGGRYELGSLAMANAGPDTNGSQFFVISGPDGMPCPRATRCSARSSPGSTWSSPSTPWARRRAPPASSVTIESVTIAESD